jgi:hypothetical protein
MRPGLFLYIIALSIAAAGCAAGTVAGSAGLSNVASAIEAVGATAAGFKSAQSAVELNGAHKELVQAQTAMTQAQVTGTQAERDRLAHERIVTAGLLRDMSRDYSEPVFLTLASWVESGGDPDFAFKYALGRIDNGNGVKVLPQQTLTIAQPAQSAPAKQAPTAAANDAALTYPELFPLY